MPKGNEFAFVALRKDCGCCVGVCTADPNLQAHNDEMIRMFLNEGLCVLSVTMEEWRDKYLPSLQKDCGHRAAEETMAALKHR